MNYLFDTCVISEMVKKHPAQVVLDWIEQQEEEFICLSVLTIGELEKGIAKLTDSHRKKKLKTWVEKDLIERFSNRILSFDLQTALLWGKQQGELERLGMRLPLMDSLIAATAIVHHLVVVTRNSQDMERLGVKIYNPWNT
ncbi:MAG: type II toxin-antitoxin system VapC family toxin [Nitrospirae bacterium]|nr:type II toxin-antitoxin system VapC family toxin [Nitrospirota bacterium]MBI3352881.1 type II toxin-antitoxin system VapC family toxin [Nitrospirota bacterium]